jgi:hypothetical protein
VRGLGVNWRKWTILGVGSMVLVVPLGFFYYEQATAPQPPASRTAALLGNGASLPQNWRSLAPGLGYRPGGTEYDLAQAKRAARFDLKTLDHASEVAQGGVISDIKGGRDRYIVYYGKGIELVAYGSTPLPTAPVDSAELTGSARAAMFAGTWGLMADRLHVYGRDAHEAKAHGSPYLAPAMVQWYVETTGPAGPYVEYSLMGLDAQPLSKLIDLASKME